MTTTKSAKTASQELAEALDHIANNIPSWKVQRSAKGFVTVTTTRGVVRVPPRFTDVDAIKILGKLRTNGLDQVEKITATKGASKKPRPAVAYPKFTLADGQRPPAYPGDPSPDAGEVQREIDLTPTLARELLERDWEATTSKGIELQQRPKNPENVSFFANLIRRKEFRLSYQGLGIGLNGSLYDGQHRCWAVIETGIAVRVRVNYNIHPDLIEALDSGSGRGTFTKLAMEKFEHAPTLGAAARLLHCWNEYEAASQLGDADMVKPWHRWYAMRVDDFTIRDVVHAHNPELYDSVKRIALAKQGKVKVNTAVATVFRYLAIREWPEGADKLDQFLQAILEGIGIDSPVHVAKSVRYWLEHKPEFLTRYNVREAQLYVLLQAWESYAKDRTRKSFNLSGPMPMPYRPK